MPADGSIFRMSCRSEFSAFGEGTVIIANRTEENQFRSPADAETHFTQEHIDGQLKYATDVNIAKGRIVFSRSYMYFFPPGT
ncbi:hypothetical protein Pla52o_21780 [Novipirellula galeiformis]|uniref:Uncharacterized protein n=1 Tax=Novipirellula galeiformis TaxID=2528004 RepID=A0A5C6CIV7_9BACT|nr:hypothetical protein [Novipirellula galeiformis]TWU24252.1 hypothetical protein Pla52o_21780 [Novipirellula galeiformis]